MPENSHPADIPPSSGPAPRTRSRARCNALIGAGVTVAPGAGLTAALWPSGDRAAVEAKLAVLRIPALGADWVQPIYEGVGDRQLKAGIGHFTYSQHPGDTGNFAIAGHRSGVSDPAFKNIDNLKTGSDIHVTTANRTTYIYTVVKVSTVDPTDVNVTAPVPGHPDQVATQKKMTIVTCWPATGHSKRVVVEADLTAARGGVR